MTAETKLNQLVVKSDLVYFHFEFLQEIIVDGIILDVIIIY